MGDIKLLQLSRCQIEAIGESVLRDFAINDETSACVPININWLARSYLGLDIQYKKLSDNGKTLGLTAYSGMEVELTFSDSNELIFTPKDTIFLDEKLQSLKSIQCRRFTIAHECGHQIIARIAERKMGANFRRVFEPGKRYTCGEIKTAEDWCEWQANSLAAALLMPKIKIAQHLTYFRRPYKLTLFGSRFNSMDYRKLKELAEMFDVSPSAMRNRLVELGHIVNKPESEYVADPLDIYVDTA